MKPRHPAVQPDKNGQTTQNASRVPTEEEEVLFRSDVVVVTDRRILFKTKSYATSAVSSVNVEADDEEAKSRPRASIPTERLLAWAIMALGLALGSIGAWMTRDTPAMMTVGLALGGIVFLVGALLAYASRGPKLPDHPTTCTVQITTIDGDKGRITGLPQQTAHQLAQAISDATARK